jgi:hypothetical protein
VPANGYTDFNITNETTYYYEVSAVTTNSEGGNSAEAVATPYNQPVLQLRLPLGETNTGTSYTTASDTNNGVANVTLSIIMPQATLPTCMARPVPARATTARHWDFSSVSAQGNGSAAPGASTTNSPALGFGTLNKWNASIWFKPSRPLPGPLDGRSCLSWAQNGTATNAKPIASRSS